MRACAAVLMTAVCFAIAAPARAGDALPGAAAPDFNAKVLPVFTKYCTGCHNSTDRDGKLVLETYADLLKGGKRGAEVVPGQSAQSRLVRVLSGQAVPAMPPKDNDRPKADEIALLAAWIDAGAKGPSGTSPDPTVLLIPKIVPTAPVREAIYSLACSPDGRWIAVGRYGKVELLAAESRAVVETLAGLPGQVNDLAYSADGSRLVAATGQPGLFGEVRIWDVADPLNAKPVRTIRGHRDSLFAVALSADGHTLATGSYDQQIILWDAASGGQLRTLSGHSGAIFSLAFSPNGRFLVSASGDRTVKLWDVASGERLETFGQPIMDQYAVAFNSAGTRVVGAGADNRIRQWSISPSGKEGTNRLLESRVAAEQPLVKLVYSPDGRTLVASSEDRTIKLWDSDKLTAIGELERQGDVAAALAFLPKSCRLVVGRMDGSLKVYDLDAKQPTSSWHPSLRPVLLAAALTTLPMAADGGGIPEQAEQEPNDTPAQANLLKKLPITVTGSLGAPGDADYFSFDATAGQTLVFDVAARRAGSEALPRLTLFDAAGKLLSDRSELEPASDPLLAYTFEKAGRYVVRIDDRTSAGGPKHTYKLTIGALPYVIGCYPLSVPAGKPSDVELIGFNLPAGAKAHVPPAAAGETAVPLDAKLCRSRGPLKILVSDLPEVLAAEPNDTPQRATPMSAPGSTAGRILRSARHWQTALASGTPEEASGIQPAGYFRFESKAGQQWIVETEAARRGSPIDTRIDVLDADGRPIPRVLLQAVRDSFINFRGIDSLTGQPRLKNYDEMELNQYIYFRGEVCKLLQWPNGPDADFTLYRDLAGKRRTYFDTTATTHANFEPVYVVEPHPPGEKLADNGLPVFQLNYTNDDDGERKLGRDSRLLFTAPVDGSYLVRVCDSRGEAGPLFVYRLIVRPPHPDFKILLPDASPMVNAGSGKRFRVQADRLDYFDGDIRLDITGVPPGFAVTTPLVIQAGHLEAIGVLSALDSAPQPTPADAAASKITATALIDGHQVSRVVGSLGDIKLAAKPRLLVRLEPNSAIGAPAMKTPVKPAHQKWFVLQPTSALAKGGATLTQLADHSLLAGGANADQESYTVVALTDAQNIRAVRLEALGDKSLPMGGPGPQRRKRQFRPLRVSGHGRPAVGFQQGPAGRN